MHKLRNRLLLISSVSGAALAIVFGLSAHFLPTSAATRTLYVDRNNPLCSDSGSGTVEQPYCTINKAATVATAGTEVIVASGTYTEKVTVANSGTDGNRIIIRAADGASVTVRGMANGFNISSKSWITIQGFTVTETSSHGISVQSSSRIIIANNHVTKAGLPKDGSTRSGIYFKGSSDSEIIGNVTEFNTNAGIFLTTGNTRVRVSGNVSNNNARVFVRAAAGIDVRGSNNNTVIGNITHHNEDSGVQFFSGSTDNFALNNLVYDNGDHGIDSSSSARQTIVGNTVFRNVTSGINVEGSATGTTLANNISVDNGINSPRSKSNIRVDSNSTTGTTINDDLVFLSQPSVQIIWGGKSYNSLAALQSATGQEARGLEADPRFVSPNTGDFHLLIDSPAIDSADSGAKAATAYDLENRPRFDVLTVPNTGVGPRDYDDRGALENQ